MSSKVLYPCIVSDFQAAFIATAGSSTNGNYCRVYFNLSKFNSSGDFQTVQATVKKQDSGLSVVKKTENRMTGIILNLTPVYDAELQKFYVDIYDSDLKSTCVIGEETYNGWIPGWIYKIQLRLSNAVYEGKTTNTVQTNIEERATAIAEYEKAKENYEKLSSTYTKLSKALSNLYELEVKLKSISDTSSTEYKSVNKQKLALEESLAEYETTSLVTLNTQVEAAKAAMETAYTAIPLKEYEDVTKVVENNANTQYTWLNANANNFSEWSTVCIIKCTGEIQVKVPAFNHYDSLTTLNNVNRKTTLTIPSLSFNGTYTSVVDTSEFLYSYELVLLDKDKNVLETSSTIYAEREITEQTLRYSFKYSPKQGEKYIIRLIVITNNLYTRTFEFNVTYLSSSLTTSAQIAVLTIDNYFEEQIAENVNVYTAPLSDIVNTHMHAEDLLDENGQPILAEDVTTNEQGILAKKHYKTVMQTLTSLDKEEEEGYICLKLYLVRGADPVYNTNIVVRRSSSQDNFATWTDIRIIPFTGTSLDTESIDRLPLIYDYTVESGVVYHYAVQIEDANGNRNSIYTAGQAAAVRYFQYSYILGENNQQLKLMYDNTMQSYKTNHIEQKTDVIGSKYSAFSRNGIVEYRTINLAGLVSFNMDDNDTFITKNKLYYNANMRALCESYNEEHGVDKVYDYTYERLFREAVMEFIQDGKPKLFKSPTEGNIIIRIMDVNFTPNQQLDRLIYSFTANAHEYDDFSFEKCVEYNFHKVGEPSKDFTDISYKVGQLRLLPFKTNTNNEQIGGLGTVASGTNVVPLMFHNYDYYGQNIAGLRYVVRSIRGLKIQVSNDRQSLGDSNYQVGYKIYYNDAAKQNPIYVINDDHVYYFDPSIAIHENDSIIIESLDGMEMEIMLDYIYEIAIKNFEDKVIEQQSIEMKVGQYAEYTIPNTSIFNEIKNKFYYDTDTDFRRVYRLHGICIEAEPGCKFDINGVNVTMNDTGYYNFYNLDEITRLTLVCGPDGQTREEMDFGANVIVNFLAYITEGTYRQEEA